MKEKRGEGGRKEGRRRKTPGCCVENRLEVGWGIGEDQLGSELLGASYLSSESFNFFICDMGTNI